MPISTARSPNSHASRGDDHDNILEAKEGGDTSETVGQDKTMPVSRLLTLRPDEASSPRAVLNAMLLPDEHILRIGRVSAGIYWESIGWLFMTVLFMVPAILFGLPAPLLILVSAALIIKALVTAAVAYLKKHYLLLAVTDKRVIIRIGIINLEIIQMRYAQIESSEIASTIPGRYFGYSSVFISGTGGQTLDVPFIANAMEIRKSITEILSRRDDAELH